MMKPECLHSETPLVESVPLSAGVQGKVWLKMEALQPPGSFKLRGIGYACQEYSREGAKRFISSSGGNAGIAVAYVGKRLRDVHWSLKVVSQMWSLVQQNDDTTERHSMQISQMIQAVDAHACGEPGRVIVGGVLDLPGDSVFKKMQHIEQHGDALRKLMLNEPRGYPASNCNLIVAPCHPEADAGYIIMEHTESSDH